LVRIGALLVFTVLALVVRILVLADWSLAAAARLATLGFLSFASELPIKDFFVIAIFISSRNFVPLRRDIAPELPNSQRF
jgi:hypothetical protein